MQFLNAPEMHAYAKELAKNLAKKDESGTSYYYYYQGDLQPAFETQFRALAHPLRPKELPKEFDDPRYPPHATTTLNSIRQGLQHVDRTSPVSHLPSFPSQSSQHFSVMLPNGSLSHEGRLDSTNITNTNITNKSASVLDQDLIDSEQVRAARREDIFGEAEFMKQLTECYKHFFANREDKHLVVENYCSLLLDAVQTAVGWLPLAGISLNLLNDKVADACILYRVFLLPS